MRISFHDSQALAQYFRLWKIDPHVLRRMRYLHYREGRSPLRLLEELPANQRAAFQEAVDWQTLEQVQRHDSTVDRSSRLVFRTPDDRRLETVIMRLPRQRISLCISSQIGCAARCVFCATGYMGIARSLTESEMIDQVVQAQRVVRNEGLKLRNVVFMGMGEPFHNLDTVCQVVETLQSPGCFGLSPQRVLVSTVGIPAAMLQFAKRFPQTGLAISLHAARQDLREQLIPLARKYPLAELSAALREAARIQRRPMMIEYLMLDQINDTDEDARLLAELVEGLHVHINLIPYNPIPQGPPHFRATPRPRRNEFAHLLRQRGHLITIRYSLGSDISAACGQLAQ